MRKALDPRDGADALLALDYEPWLAQRLVHRSKADRRVIVAARQVGKTTSAAYEVLRVAIEEAGSTSLILAPTKQFLRRAVDKVREYEATVPGLRWKEQRLRFELENGSTIECVSAESADGEAARGLTVDGILWIDEAALLLDRVYQVAKNTLLATQGRLLITTTPVGQDWVWREYTRKTDGLQRFRFRAVDSPYMNKARLAENRREALPEQAAQELDAMFVDQVVRPFPDLSRLFVPKFPVRPPSRDTGARLQNVIGLDLGERRDFTVCVLMNLYGEARVLGRWQHVEWADSMGEVARLALLHDALVVVDDGVGSPVGGAVEHELTTRGVKQVRRVHTATPGVKQDLVDMCRNDVRHERIHVLRDPSDPEGRELADELRHELTNFQGVRRVVHGKVVVSYHAPQVAGEHDDCVIALCLANWGRAELTGGPPQGGDPDVPLDEVVRWNKEIGRRLGGGGFDPYGGFFGGGGGGGRWNFFA